MAEYSRKRVDDFVASLNDNQALDLLVQIESHQQYDMHRAYVPRKKYVEFEQLSNWERANVVYGLRDRVEKHLVRMARYYVQLARAEDEGKVGVAGLMPYRERPAGVSVARHLTTVEPISGDAPR